MSVVLDSVGGGWVATARPIIISIYIYIFICCFWWWCCNSSPRYMAPELITAECENASSPKVSGGSFLQVTPSFLLLLLSLTGQSLGQHRWREGYVMQYSVGGILRQPVIENLMDKVSCEKYQIVNVQI